MNTNRPLKQRREELGLTLRETAQRSGIPASNLSMIERGRRGISTANLTRLARVLGLHSLASELSYWTGERS
jgi:transcriptional regulator with XRE-family HTH domain